MNLGRTTRLVVTTVVVGTLILIEGSSAFAQGSNPTASAAPTLRHVAGRLLIKTRPGLAATELDRLLREHGNGRRAQRIAALDVHVIELPRGVDERVIADRLRGHPHLKFAELDRIMPHALTTNDPGLSSSWHLGKINALQAWDGSSGQGVTIAILDSGVDGSHPDLAGSMIPGWNVYDNNADTRDVEGHGTLVAGTAAAIANNGQGSAGVAWGARIMPIRVADPSGWATWSAMAAGITWAADNGARVANLSFQGSCGSGTVQSAANYMRSRGGVVVMAAGNTGTPLTDAPSDALTCVSATDSNDAVTGWSSFGDAVDVAAPGLGVYTTSNGGGYAAVSGTSFSAPIVAGAYALMMTANWSLAPATLDAILTSTAIDLGASGKDPYYGAGRIDVAAAVARAASTVAIDTTPPQVSFTALNAGTRVNGIAAIDITASDASGVARVELLVNGTLFATDSAAPFGFALDTSRWADGTTLNLTARAYDRVGNTNSATIQVLVANDTIAPTVAIASPGNGATVSGIVGVAVNAQDNKAVSRLTLPSMGAWSRMRQRAA